MVHYGDAKSPKKQSVECIFDNMALYFDYILSAGLTKNALLPTVFFLAILPTGICRLNPLRKLNFADSSMIDFEI